MMQPTAVDATTKRSRASSWPSPTVGIALLVALSVLLGVLAGAADDAAAWTSFGPSRSGMGSEHATARDTSTVRLASAPAESPKPAFGRAAPAQRIRIPWSGPTPATRLARIVTSAPASVDDGRAAPARRVLARAARAPPR